MEQARVRRRAHDARGLRSTGSSARACSPGSFRSSFRRRSGPTSRASFSGRGRSSVVSRPGDRVVGRLDPLVGGALGERVVVPARTVVPVPVSLELDEAAALSTVAGIAWQALFETGRLRAGERVAIGGRDGRPDRDAPRRACGRGGRRGERARSRPRRRHDGRDGVRETTSWRSLGGNRRAARRRCRRDGDRSRLSAHRRTRRARPRRDEAGARQGPGRTVSPRS